MRHFSLQPRHAQHSWQSAQSRVVRQQWGGSSRVCSARAWQLHMHSPKVPARLAEVRSQPVHYPRRLQLSLLLVLTAVCLWPWSFTSMPAPQVVQQLAWCFLLVLSFANDGMVPCSLSAFTFLIPQHLAATHR